MSTEPQEPWHGAALGSGFWARLKWLWDSRGGGRLHVACAVASHTALLGSLGQESHAGHRTHGVVSQAGRALPCP